MYGKVTDIYNYLGHLYKLGAFFIIFRIMFIYNVQKPYFELTELKNELKDYSENLDRVVDIRTETLKRMNQKFLDDLEYARDIQRAILPNKLPQEPEVEFCVKYFPAESVSGDFYNVFKLDENNFGLYIGDVSGHGVPAAMLMVFINQCINTMKDIGSNTQEIIKPSGVLKNLYESFNKTNFKEDIYLVLLYAVYNIEAQELTYSSAGLNVQPIIIHDSGEIQNIEITGFPICKFIDFYQANYIDQKLSLNKNDKILFYTDGLIEAENKNGEFYLEERLLKVLKSSSSQDCTLLAENIEESVFRFMDNNVLKDDITYFIMEIKG